MPVSGRSRAGQRKNSVRLDLLGGVTLTRAAGTPLEGGAGQRRSLALLSVLAVHAARGISREKISALLWPESDADHAAHRLKQAIYVIRRELGPEAVVGVHQLRLGLDVVSCDVCDLRDRLARGDLEGAVALYEGPFLDGFHIGGESDEFERWADDWRERLMQDCAEALERLADAAAARGDHAAALRAWRRLTDLAPLDARYARGIVAALVARGDSVGALRHADRFRRLVQEELGVPPDPSLERLTALIRADLMAPPP